MLYTGIIAALSSLDLGIKWLIEQEKPEEFPKPLPHAKGKILLYRNHNAGFPFGFLEQHAELVTPQDILVIGADTVVAYENQILGKPKDEEDARRMLSMLSGKTNSVYTGVTFVFIDKAGRTGEHCFYEKTDVSMYTLTEDEIDRYISSGDPMDKAGSYGIQGRFAIHIKGIHGDYNNVVGLPVARLYQELRKLGVDV